jgi:hypothetical protein
MVRSGHLPTVVGLNEAAQVEVLLLLVLMVHCMLYAVMVSMSTLEHP